jgi:hypothetical protein
MYHPACILLRELQQLRTGRPPACTTAFFAILDLEDKASKASAALSRMEMTLSLFKR